MKSFSWEPVMVSLPGVPTKGFLHAGRRGLAEILPDRRELGQSRDGPHDHRRRHRHREHRLLQSAPPQTSFCEPHEPSHVVSPPAPYGSMIPPDRKYDLRSTESTHTRASREFGSSASGPEDPEAEVTSSGRRRASPYPPRFDRGPSPP